jgi:hypothetical protein
MIGDTVNLTITGTGVGQPGNFNIGVGGSAIVGPGTEFEFFFPDFELKVDVGANELEVRFGRRGSSGNLSGPVTWTLSDPDLFDDLLEIVGITPLPPSFGTQLPVQSFQIIDGHTVRVTTGPTAIEADQNARFQLAFAAVPEPSTLTMCSLAVGAMACRWHRKRSSRCRT